jgi:hypothetical protein
MARRYDVRHPRSTLARWVRRVFGVAGTAVVLAVGVMIATMVLPAGDDDASAPLPAAMEARDADRPKVRLTARQREQRRRAVDAIRRRGYTPVSLADYRADQVLRVLIGEPVGTTSAGLRAFFFLRDDFIGQDATSASLALRVGGQRGREITLVYTLYEEGDRECCPRGGERRVRFRWTGDALEPREAIPPDFQRLPPAFART